MIFKCWRICLRMMIWEYLRIIFGGWRVCLRTLKLRPWPLLQSTAAAAKLWRHHHHRHHRHHHRFLWQYWHFMTIRDVVIRKEFDLSASRGRGGGGASCDVIQRQLFSSWSSYIYHHICTVGESVFVSGNLFFEAEFS